MPVSLRRDRDEADDDREENEDSEEAGLSDEDDDRLSVTPRTLFGIVGEDAEKDEEDKATGVEFDLFGWTGRHVMLVIGDRRRKEGAADRGEREGAVERSSMCTSREHRKEGRYNKRAFER